MSISIKTAREIEKMRRAGELLEKVHDELGRAIHPGMSTWEINKLGEENDPQLWMHSQLFKL